jgi:hypothetical protein
MQNQWKGNPMTTLHLDLTDQENDSLLTIARQTGKNQERR